jgi:hypothetical protein
MKSFWRQLDSEEKISWYKERLCAGSHNPPFKGEEPRVTRPLARWGNFAGCPQIARQAVPGTLLARALQGE